MGRRTGGLPWYAHPDLAISFFRPISSLLIYMDHKISPRSTVWGHLHTFAWYLLLLIIVSRIHLRLLSGSPPWVAPLATLIFAMDEAHGFPVAWLANRNAVIATALGSLALLLHLRWRQDGKSADGILAPCALALGLASGEAAIGMVAYPAAYALLLDRGRLLSRALTVTPYLGVVLIWRVAFVLLDHGVVGSGLYIDPASSPLEYLEAALIRVPMLLMAQLSLFTTDFYIFLPTHLVAWYALFAAMVLLAMGLAGRRWLRSDPLVSFSLLTMLLCILPMAATFPNDRLLLPVGVGGSALIAHLLSLWWQERISPNSANHLSRGPRLLAGFLILSHLIYAPLSRPPRALSPGLMGRVFDQTARSMDRLGPLEGRTVYIINGLDFFYSCFTPLIRHSLGLTGPDRLFVLGTSVGPISVTRPKIDTLELTAERGFLTSPFDILVRSRNAPFRVGQILRHQEHTIQVTAITSDGRPAAIRCRFRRPPGSAGRIWGTWGEGGFVPFSLPPLGGRAELPETDIGDLIWLAF